MDTAKVVGFGKKDRISAVRSEENLPDSMAKLVFGNAIILREEVRNFDQIKIGDSVNVK